LVGLTASFGNAAGELGDVVRLATDACDAVCVAAGRRKAVADTGLLGRVSLLARSIAWKLLAREEIWRAGYTHSAFGQITDALGRDSSYQQRNERNGGEVHAENAGRSG
jgi:hypothetical protein